MQLHRVYLYLQTALHVSGGISTHHQEIIPLYLQHLVLLRPLLLHAVSSRPRHLAVTVSIMPATVDTVIWAPDDGWRYHPKHVEQFADINKLYIVSSCWIIIDIYYAMHWPINIKKIVRCCYTSRWRRENAHSYWKRNHPKVHKDVPLISQLTCPVNAATEWSFAEHISP